AAGPAQLLKRGSNDERDLAQCRVAKAGGHVDKGIASTAQEREVRIPIGARRLEGSLALPHNCSGVILFAHGSGSSRYSPRNRFVAQFLQERGLGTLLMDLLTAN